MMPNCVRSFAANRRAKHFANGFSWAATELLQGKSIEEIESHIDYAIDPNGFESGAYSAIAKWEKLHPEKTKDTFIYE